MKRVWNFMPDSRYTFKVDAGNIVLIVPGDQSADHHTLDIAEAERLNVELNSVILDFKRNHETGHTVTPHSVAQHMAEAIEHIRMAEMSVRAANPGMFSTIGEFLALHELETKARSLLIGFMGACSSAHEAWYKSTFPEEHAAMLADRIETERRKCATNPIAVDPMVIHDIDATE